MVCNECKNGHEYKHEERSEAGRNEGEEEKDTCLVQVLPKRSLELVKILEEDALKV